jgi:hypothetical protein
VFLFNCLSSFPLAHLISVPDDFAANDKDEDRLSEQEQLEEDVFDIVEHLAKQHGDPALSHIPVISGGKYLSHTIPSSEGRYRHDTSNGERFKKRLN